MYETTKAGLLATLLSGAVVILGCALARAQTPPIMILQGTLCNTPEQMAEVVLASDDVDDDTAIEDINNQYNDPHACMFAKWAVAPIVAVASVRNQSGDHRIVRVMLFRIEHGLDAVTAIKVGEQYMAFADGGAP